MCTPSRLFLIWFILMDTVQLVFGGNFLAHRRWTKMDGLPDQSIYAVTEDRFGFLLLGTSRGLCRFNGTNFHQYGLEEGLPENTIIELYQASDALWVAFDSGEIYRQIDNTFTPYRVPNVSNSVRILAIEKDHLGELWGLDDKGILYRFRDGFSISLQDVRQPRDWSQVQLLAHDKLGLLAVFGGCLYRIENDHAEAVEEWASNIVISISESGDGGLWIETHQEILLWDAMNGDFSHKIGEIMNARPHRLHEWDNGALVAGTTLNGLYIIQRDGSYMHIGDEIIGKGAVTRLFCDASNALWIVTRNSGITRIGSSAFDYLTPPEELLASPIRSVSKSDEGGIWVGTAGDGLYHYSNGVWNSEPILSGLVRGHMTAVYEDSNRRLWTGFWGEGLFFREPNGKIERLARDFNHSDRVYCIYESSDGTIWITTSRGLLQYSNGNAIWHDVSSGLPNSCTELIDEDSKGRIWFTIKDHGIAYWEKGSIFNYPIDSISGEGGILGFCIDQFDRLWIATDQGHLLLHEVNASTTRKINSNFGIFTSIREDLSGNLC